MAKQRVLIVGGGSKFGKILSLGLLEQEYEVDIITSTGPPHSDIQYSKVDWDRLNHFLSIKALEKFKSGEPYNLIIFSQNAGSQGYDAGYGKMNINEHAAWTQQFFTNVQFIDIVISELTDRIISTTKIMALASGIIQNTPTVEDNKEIILAEKFAGYAGMKSYVYYMMQGYNKYKTGNFITVNPGHMNNEEQYSYFGKGFLEFIKATTDKELKYGMYTAYSALSGNLAYGNIAFANLYGPKIKNK